MKFAKTNAHYPGSPTPPGSPEVAPVTSPGNRGLLGASRMLSAWVRPCHSESHVPHRGCFFTPTVESNQPTGRRQAPPEPRLPWCLGVQLPLCSSPPGTLVSSQMASFGPGSSPFPTPQAQGFPRADAGTHCTCGGLEGGNSCLCCHRYSGPL